MPTIIDSLIVTLGLDPSGFTKGQKDAAASMVKTKEHADKTAKDIAESNKRAAESFNKIKDEVLSLTAVLLGGYGIKEFTEHVVTSDAAVGRLSKNLGITTEQLSTMEGLAERFGGTSGDMDNAFRNIERMMAEFTDPINGGNFKGMQQLIALGVDTFKFTRDQTTNLERYHMIQEAVARASPRVRQSLGGQAGFTESSLDVMAKTADQFEELYKEQEKLTAISQEQAKAAEELEEKWKALTQEMTQLGRKILNDVAPALKVIADDLEKFATFAKEHLGATEVVVGTLGAALGVLTAVSFGKLIAGLLGVRVAALGAGAAATAGAAEAGAAATGLMATLGPLLTAIGIIAAPAAAAGLLSGFLKWLKPNHKNGDVDPDTGKVWDSSAGGTTRAGGRTGDWVDKGGKPLRHWQSTGHGGHWVYDTPAASGGGKSSSDPVDYDNYYEWFSRTKPERFQDRLAILQDEAERHPGDDINRDIARVQKELGAGPYAQSLGRGISNRPSPSHSISAGTNTASISFGNVNIYANGRDGKQIANDFMEGVHNFTNTWQFNSGPR